MAMGGGGWLGVAFLVPVWVAGRTLSISVCGSCMINVFTQATSFAVCVDSKGLKGVNKP